MTSGVTVVVATGAWGRSTVPAVRAALAAGAAQVVVAVSAAEEEAVRRMVAATSAEVVVAGLSVAEQRNAGVAAALHDVVAIVDAGSLVTAAWLEAIDLARGDAIMRPELVVGYGEVVALWPQHQPSAATLLPVLTPWGSPVAARRTVLVQHPFPPVADETVDAAWQTTLIRDGVTTEIADATAVLVRTWTRTPPWSRPAGTPVPLAVPRPSTDVQVRTPRRRKRVVRLAARAFRSVTEPWIAGFRRVRKRLEAGRALPPWLPPELAILHAIEPLVPYPHRLLGDRFDRWGDPWAAEVIRTAARYAAVRARLPERVDYLYFAPWLRLGGGDQVLLDYATAVHRLDPDASIGLITTEPVRSTRLAELPADASAVELLDLFDLPSDRDLLADHVLPQLIADLAPHAVHAFNSTLAFDVVERHPDAIAPSVFLSSFAIDRAPSGEQTSALFHRTPRFLDGVDAVLVDSDRFIERLSTEHGYNAAQFHVQPHIVPEMPESTPEPARPYGPEAPLRVLWVGRFDFPKRLDILAAVSRAVGEEGLPVVFEFYGEEVMGSPILAATLDDLRASGAVRHPPYAGFESLPLSNFGTYLMTSEWEGLPLSLLEAMGAGLPSIAPDVGAIANVLGPETGYLIDRFDDVEAYLKALRAIVADPIEASRRGGHARSLVRRRFSAAAFDAGLKAVPGYLRRDAEMGHSTRFAR